jgi:N-acetylmuramoyl-L-alanine amidase
MTPVVPNRADGMRAERIDRVKRRLLQEAVADNLETMSGLPPRALRRRRRFLAAWIRRAPIVLVPMLLIATSYLASTGEPVAAVQKPVPPPPVLKPAAPVVVAASTPLATIESPLQRVAAAAFPLSIRRVVLDAGHGGKDAGATRMDVIEKDITLDIGERLRRKLEESGFEVVVTRSDDKTIALRERAQLANESRADIFVSIHVNSIVKYTASRGIETYYLGPTNDPTLTRLAAAENIGSGYSMADLRRLLEGVYADARRDESRQLATTVQQHLYSRLKTADSRLENWGIKRAPFVVLVATDMPAILAEVGCISNPKEVKMLATETYRQEIADALFEGIHAYASAHDAPQKKGT